MTKESIDGIVVNLEIEDNNVLFVLLAADGLCSRTENGTKQVSVFDMDCDRKGRLATSANSSPTPCR